LLELLTIRTVNEWIQIGVLFISFSFTFFCFLHVGFKIKVRETVSNGLIFIV